MTWLERLRLWRDRQIASPRFRRWAANFPLTRPIARRRARELSDLVAGFTYSQVLLACVRLQLFEQLADGPLGLADLARRSGLGIDAMARLLDAAVALRLMQRLPGPVSGVTRGSGSAPEPGAGQPSYRLGPLGAPLVGNAGLLAMIEHHSLLYADLADPVTLLRARHAGAALAEYWPYAAESAGVGAAPTAVKPPPDDGHAPAPSPAARYSALMAASQPLVAEEVLACCDLSGFRRLLDVGGGLGTFAAAVAERWPQLQLQVFDLPPVISQARAHLERLGLDQRIALQAGSFLKDELPLGADLISLVRVVHDHEDAAVLTLLSAVRRALPPQGALLLAEPLADTPGARAMGHAYFGLYLWAMGSGRPRSLAELTRLLQRAGFAAPRLLRNPMPLQTRVLLVRPDPRHGQGRRG
jgi:demethylspheroidene O-methyltransferase